MTVRFGQAKYFLIVHLRTFVMYRRRITSAMSVIQQLNVRYVRWLDVSGSIHRGMHSQRPCTPRFAQAQPVLLLRASHQLRQTENALIPLCRYQHKPAFSSDVKLTPIWSFPCLFDVKTRSPMGKAAVTLPTHHAATAAAPGTAI